MRRRKPNRRRPRQAAFRQGLLSPPAAAPGTVAKIPTAASPPTTKVVPQQVTGPMPEVLAPHVTSNAEGQLTAADAQHISESVSALPVSDPALNVTAGAAPTLALEGAADPQRAAEQRDAVAKSSQLAAEAARRDAAQPMGEDHIVPTVPSETLRGTVPAAAKAAAAGGGAAAAPADADAAVAAVAREKSADQVRAAAAAGSQDLAAKRTEQQSKMTQARADSQRDMDTEVAAAGSAQDAERSKARGEVVALRRQWGSEQRDTLAKADADSDQEVVAARRQAVTHQQNANAEADDHIADGNKKITTARADAENEGARRA